MIHSFITSFNTHTVYPDYPTLQFLSNEKILSKRYCEQASYLLSTKFIILSHKSHKLPILAMINEFSKSIYQFLGNQINHRFVFELENFYFAFAIYLILPAI